MTLPIARVAAPLSFGRRGLLGAALAAPILAASCVPKSAAQTIGFASTGGVYNGVLRRVWIDDFTKRTGIQVNLSSNTSLTQTRLQAATDRPQWDVVELTGPWYEMAVRQGLLLPLDTDIVRLKSVGAEYVRSHGVQYALFNNCIAWDRRQVPDRLAPQGWADVWDTRRRPGRRSLDGVNAGAGPLEMALMADGADPAKLYPLDLDRAFKSLDRLGQDHILWSQSFEEPVQRMISQEVSIAASWPLRVTSANKGGADLGYTINQCNLDGDWLGVVKTSRNPQAAFRLIDTLINSTAACAEFSRLTHYGTPNLDSLKLMPQADADQTPTNPKLAQRLFRPDDAWWADNLERVHLRFKKWQLGIAA